MPVDSRLYWIWLQQALPLGHSAADALLRGGLRPEELYGADGRRLRELGLDGARFAALQQKSLEPAGDILQKACSGGNWILTPDDAYYPARLREIYGGPLLLFCRGELPDLESVPAFGIVGTRKAGESGKRNAACLGAGLAAAGMVVVSGGADGIDGAAHFGAVRSGGRTILVKAGALDDPYPAINRELRDEIVQSGGLLVSEYPPGSRRYCDFHIRNRLISGLSVGVCLVETPAKSGALITDTLAREQGRDVYAMPGDVQSHRNDGAHTRIQEGARLVIRAEDILSDYDAQYPGLFDWEAAAKAQEAMAACPPHGRPADKPPPCRRVKPPPPAREPAPLPAGVSDETRRLYEALTREPLPLERLAEAAGLTAAAALTAMTGLELSGCAQSHAGRQYSLGVLHNA